MQTGSISIRTFGISFERGNGLPQDVYVSSVESRGKGERQVGNWTGRRLFLRADLRAVRRFVRTTSLASITPTCRGEQREERRGASFLTVSPLDDIFRAVTKPNADQASLLFYSIAWGILKIMTVETRRVRSFLRS